MDSSINPSMAKRVEVWSIDRLKPYKKNARTHDADQVAQIAASITQFGFLNPILVDGENGIIAGHGRLLAAKDLGMTEVPVVPLEHLTPEQKKAYVIADNQLAQNAGWDESLLREELQDLKLSEFDLDLLGFGPETLDSLFDDDMENIFGDNDPTEPEGDPLAYGDPKELQGSLAESFGIPPFSVLNAREGWWQTRKKHWINLGIQSDEGRDENILGYDNLAKALGRTGVLNSSTSIFDPVLAELCYRWWSPSGSLILDPFAGGSVRGIVAGKCDRKYFGVDLREEQVLANEQQAAVVAPECDIKWQTGDSLEIKTLLPDLEADMVFTCPPYADLEKYSDDPQDLSNMKYPEFIEKYKKIIADSCSLLKDNRFAAIVVGEIRKKDGGYYNFVGDTIQAFLDAGLSYYNEAILVTMAGSLPLRTRQYFEVSRKLGKTHQNILVFCKGDPRIATQACGECEFGEINEDLADHEQEPEATEYGEKVTAESIGGEL